MTNNPRTDKFLTLFLLLVLGFVLFRTAWVGDDVYITLRTVHNFTSGYGLSWNVDERVQSYTHPLWMVMMIPVYAISHNAYFTVLFLSFGATSILFLLIVRQRNAAFILVLLLLSKAFMDYSVSGLENPATHVLLLAFIILFIRSDDWTDWRIFGMSFITALAILTRMDAALFFAPPLAYLLFRHFSTRTVFILASGFIPVGVWEMFSLFYYGFPLPNTAYAKLGTGLSRMDLVKQSLVYFTDSFSHDPLTLILIGAGLIFVFWKGKVAERFVAAGVALYMLYVVNIGGDFMSGRFFSAAFLVTTVLIASILGQKNSIWKVSIVAVALCISLTAPSPSIFPSMDQLAYTQKEIETGIYDERAFYYQDSGLIPMIRSDGQSLLNQTWVRAGLKLRSKKVPLHEALNVGFMGYFAGPDIHIVDRYALCDPLLARLPVPQNEQWRIGHFKRHIPEGYWETLKTGENQIVDPDLAEYYEKLAFIVRAPLENPERLRVIWEMNTGYYDHLLEQYHP